jgi:hypothetical protein
MVLSWKIRYLDSTDREFKDRRLWLDTEDLDSLLKASIETCYNKRKHGPGRDILKFRQLFKPEATSGEIQARIQLRGNFHSVHIHDYFEDEHGREMPSNSMAKVLSGNESAITIPPGFRPHDIEFFFSKPPPVDVSTLSLSTDQRTDLACFVRDLSELRATAFLKEGPGTLSMTMSRPPSPATLETAVSDEEVRSFVMVFRRLYLEEDRANIIKTVKIVGAALKDHPMSKWLRDCRKQITSTLNNSPDFAPFVDASGPKFTVKKLVDVFLYTQYVHQPSNERLGEFDGLLKSVGGDRAKLAHLFLSEIWQLAIEYLNLGQHLAHFYEAYCAFHGKPPVGVPSLADAGTGIGSLEKSGEREVRVFRENAVELAKQMWREAGEPPGGWTMFEQDAFRRLGDALRVNDGK